MENLRKKARKLVEGFEYDCGHCNTFNLDEWCVIMIEFAHQQCEEQKKLCAENSKLSITYYEEVDENNNPIWIKELESSKWKGDYCYSADKESILNTPNVCKI